MVPVLDQLGPGPAPTESRASPGQSRQSPCTNQGLRVFHFLTVQVGPNSSNTVFPMGAWGTGPKYALSQPCPTPPRQNTSSTVSWPPSCEVSDTGCHKWLVSPLNRIHAVRSNRVGPPTVHMAHVEGGGTCWPCPACLVLKQDEVGTVRCQPMTQTLYFQWLHMHMSTVRLLRCPSEHPGAWGASLSCLELPGPAEPWALLARGCRPQPTHAHPLDTRPQAA